MNVFTTFSSTTTRVSTKGMTVLCKLWRKQSACKCLTHNWENIWKQEATRLTYLHIWSKLIFKHSHCCQGAGTCKKRCTFSVFYQHSASPSPVYLGSAKAVKHAQCHIEFSVRAKSTGHIPEKVSALPSWSHLLVREPWNWPSCYRVNCAAVAVKYWCLKMRSRRICIFPRGECPIIPSSLSEEACAPHLPWWATRHSAKYQTC